MAVVFDLSQVAAEYTAIVVPILKITDKKVNWACRFIIVSCTLVSMVMNIRAFLAHADTGFEICMAIVRGMLLPLLVLLLCYVAAVFITANHHQKS